MFNRLSLVVIFLSLFGCGGGGGGGGSSADREGVRVLNASIDSVPVDIVVDGALIEGSTAKFAVSSGYHSVGGGEHTVNVVPHGDPARTLFSFAQNYDGGKGYSIIFYGSRDTALNAQIVADAPESVATDSIAIRIVNGISNVESFQAILNGVGTKTAIKRGQASDYLAVPIGPVQVTVTTPGGRSIFSGLAELEAGNAYTIVIAGEEGYFIKQVVYSD